MSLVMECHETYSQDCHELRTNLKRKGKILVTGGNGSLGSALVSPHHPACDLSRKFNAVRNAKAAHRLSCALQSDTKLYSHEISLFS